MKINLSVYDFVSVDLFAPWVLFPSIYILYFAFGSIKLTILPSPTPFSIILVFLALIFYLLGSYTSLYFWHNKKTVESINNGLSNIYVDKIIQKVIKTSLVLIFIAILIQSFKYGIPILSPGIRGGTSIEILPSAKLYALFGLIPLTLSLYIASKINSDMRKSYLVGLFILGAIATLFTSYRSIIVLYLLTVLILVNYLYKKLAYKLLLPFAAFLGLVIVGVQQYRLSEIYGTDATNRFLKYINPNGFPDALIAAHLPCHEGASVFSDIVNFSTLFGSLHGRFFSSIFETMLPGIQIGPRTFISLLRKTSLASSTTPSILGGPYLDFGVLGIAVFMFAVGSLLTFLYLTQMHTSKISPESFRNRINVVSYSYTLSLMILSIHSGLLDPILIFSLMIIIFIQSIANDWFLNKYVPLVWIAIISIPILCVSSSIIYPVISSPESSMFKYCDENIDENGTIYLDQYLSMSGMTFEDAQFKDLNDIYYRLMSKNIKDIGSSYIGLYIRHNIFYNSSFNRQFEERAGMNTIYASDETKLFRLIFN